MKTVLMLDRAIVGYVPVRVVAFEQHRPQDPTLVAKVEQALSSARKDDSSPVLVTLAGGGNAVTPHAPASHASTNDVPSYNPPAAQQPAMQALYPMPTISFSAAIRDLLAEVDHQFAVLVSNLTPACTETELRDFFALCGRIVNVILLR